MTLARIAPRQHTDGWIAKLQRSIASTHAPGLALVLVIGVGAISAGCDRGGDKKNTAPGSTPGIGAASGSPGAAPGSASGKPTAAPSGPTATSEGGIARLHVPPRAPTGEAAPVFVEIEARPGFHLNADYPHVVRFESEPTARVGAARVDKSSGLAIDPCQHSSKAQCRARAATTLAADAAGDVPLRARVSYAVCDADRCLIEKPTLTATLRVEPAR